MTAPTARIAIGLLFLALNGVAQGAAPAPVAVEPSALTKRPDLIGREVSVDDRVTLFLNHPGRDFDEITLKRTPVVFRLPPRLRFRQHPGVQVVRLQGILKRESDQWVCDVTAIELLPRDLDRLNRGVAALPAGEYKNRANWADWAMRRAKDFQDESLLKRAREVEADAIRIEANHEGADPAGHWLALALRAREHGVDEPEPSAIAHLAFRARGSKARTVEDLRSLIADVASFFPKAGTPAGPPPEDLGRWEAPYDRAPADGYRAAPPAVRTQLDRRLWADATQRLLELQAAAAPQDGLTLAEQARDQLPDRPRVAAQLLEKGLEASTSQVAGLRLGEVENLAKLYRTQLNKPDEAHALLRRWLEERRTHALSPTDAEGRVALASQYEKLIGDKATAIELLQSAWKIDPQSRELSDAFRRRGFRKVNDEWVEPAQANRQRSESSEPTSPPLAVPLSQSRRLLNLGPKEVRRLLGGKPNRVVISVSQGQVVEQWVYFGPSQNQYINFLKTPDEGTPRVFAYYSLPRPPGSTLP